MPQHLAIDQGCDVAVCGAECDADPDLFAAESGEVGGYAINAARGEHGGEGREDTDKPHPLACVAGQVTGALLECLRLIQRKERRLHGGCAFDGGSERHRIGRVRGADEEYDIRRPF